MEGSDRRVIVTILERLIAGESGQSVAKDYGFDRLDWPPFRRAAGMMRKARQGIPKQCFRCGMRFGSTQEYKWVYGMGIDQKVPVCRRQCVPSLQEQKPRAGRRRA